MEVKADLGETSPMMLPTAPRHLNELVFDVLKDHIRRDVLRDGLILRQDSVSKAFGVGRAPAAMALRKLENEGLIRKRVGHGFVISRGNSEVEPLELDLEDAGLRFPGHLRKALKRQRRKDSILPEVEMAVASCIVFGRFRINQTALAEHYGVSRTVANEILANLEGLDFTRLESNARWYRRAVNLGRDQRVLRALAAVRAGGAAPSTRGIPQ